MADSDTTTTLPIVTRRRVLAGTAIAMAACQPAAFARDDLEKDQSTDPAVAVWGQWQAASEQTERLCRQQQRLERKLVETVGFPCTTIQLSDGERVAVHSLEVLQELLSVRPADEAARAQAEADIAAHQARWDAADKEIGYSATLLAEYEAAERVEALLKVLSEAPATSLAGVAAKLDAVLREGEDSQHSGEFPWPQIRSARDDIGRISEQTESS